MARRTKIELARDRNELARLALNTRLCEHRAKILSKYDATEGSKARRQPVRETGNEDKIYPMRKRTLGTNIGRDLERNYAPAKGIINQFRMNVVGSLGKVQVNIEGGDDAAAWFNSEWAKDCDFRDDMHFSEVLQNVVAGVIREGDLLAVVDDDLIEDSGKLVHWESDQIVPLIDTLIPAKYRSASQENGIIRDKWGRVLAYVVTGKHGLTVLDKFDDATIWERQNARHVKNPWRINQGRGVPSLITNATNFLDLYEILSAELASAKRTAIVAGFAKRKDAVTDWDNTTQTPGFLPENSGKDAATTAAEGANSTDPSARNYEKFENLSGGYFEYLDAGDEIEFPDIKRPNSQMAPFIEAVLGYAGASMGLARAYSLLRADSSYTSFRGDMILSWASAFYPMQKWLERRYADWVAVKVLTWAQRKKIFKPLPAGWEKTISWLWPVMPAVNELEEEKGKAEALKNATTDYSRLWGPDWRTHMAALAVQLNFARDLQLPLSVFEQKSGGAAPSEKEDAK
jgi:capsid protein